MRPPFAGKEGSGGGVHSREISPKSVLWYACQEKERNIPSFFGNDAQAPEPTVPTHRYARVR